MSHSLTDGKAMTHDNATDIVGEATCAWCCVRVHADGVRTLAGMGEWAREYAPALLSDLATLRKQLEKSDAMQDLAYYNGAKQYAVMAGESEEAAQEWLLGGCGNRQQDAIRALKGQPVNKPSGIAVDSPTSIQHDKSGYTP